MVLYGLFLLFLVLMYLAYCKGQTNFNEIRLKICFIITVISGIHYLWFSEESFTRGCKNVLTYQRFISKRNSRYHSPLRQKSNSKFDKKIVIVFFRINSLSSSVIYSKHVMKRSILNVLRKVYKEALNNVTVKSF